MELSQMLAKDLLSIRAVQVNPNNYFTWTSGIRSPIYCDNRLTMSYPVIRNRISDAFVQLIKQMTVKPDVIAGCATAGIPHAAWLAEKLDLPMIYVRSKPKGHGKGNQIEGDFKPGQKVVVIEDLISTGGSSIEAAHALKEAGGDVISVLAIFTYGLQKANQNFANAGITFQTITGFDLLVDALVADGKFDVSVRQQLIAWRDTL